MLTDANLRFSAAQTASGDSENILDTKQKTVGGGNKPFFATVYAVEGFANAGKLTVEVQEADDKTGTFVTVASSGEADIALGKQVAVPIPLRHKRFLKLKYTAAGTSGKVDAYLTESVDTWEALPANSYRK